MPTYVFRNDATGETVDQVYPSNAIPEQVQVGERVFKRDVNAEILGQCGRVRGENGSSYGPTKVQR